MAEEHKENLETGGPARYEQHRGASEAAGERLKSLEKNGRTSAETLPDQSEAAEKARSKVEREAISGKEAGKEQKSGGEPDAAPKRPTVSREEKQAEYQKTMHSVRKQMSSPSRGFSKAIHQPAVEKASHIAGSSIARPNAILWGSMTAFVVVLGVYLLARYNGFRLSGTETIAAFIIGWIIGMLVDFLRFTFKRRRA